MPKKTRDTSRPAVKKRYQRRKPRPSTVTVYLVHCGSCKQRYELAYTGELKFCIYCASDQIEKSVRNREETSQERQQRIDAMTAHIINAGFRIIAGLFGFEPVSPHRGQSISELEAELMKEGYRKLAQKYHPDKGGDPEKMKELNRLKEKLGL